jgi:hypothetical protein
MFSGKRKHPMALLRGKREQVVGYFWRKNRISLKNNVMTLEQPW